ncbi:hypothetical protein BWQ96_08492 [Gracilariopsis chorda]|uniref:Uncharacterized protein n=1 Tax=Gracilariopsis chorda TaxID=448386 RepID=A0A2V3II75_9FLOR|nr:hypothetical protein BWQ96_08492 [Gracilariopsis chorda]|eukprot:PXF41771.1 hypothetical protein BWQ96_08492 [Gracilariopsis chorda]
MPAPVTAPQPRTPLGPWELRGASLSPTRCHLQAHARRLQSQSSTDPLITIIVQPPYTPPHAAPPATPALTIHRSLLRAASPVLSALIPADARSPVRVLDWPDTFSLLRKFLYLQPLDLAVAPPDLPLAAARWGLNQLFEACFAYAERNLPTDMRALLWRWMPVLNAVRVPPTFKTTFALSFVAALDEHPLQRTWLSSAGARGDYSQLPDDYGLFAPCQCSVTEPPANSPAHDKLLILASIALRSRTKATCPNRCNAHTVWTVFHAQDMLVELITYLFRMGAFDYGILVLDVLLRQLEPALSDQELITLLRRVPWQNGYAELLASREALQWSSRAWQKLFHARQTLTTTDRISLPLIMSAFKRALPEPGLRAVRWESERVTYDATPDTNLQFALSVACDTRKSRRLPPLQATVRVVAGDARPISKMRVHVRAYVTAQCGCDIRGKSGAFAGTELDTGDDHVMGSFVRVGGVSFKVLDGSALKEWIDCHTDTCTMRLVVHVSMERERERENGVEYAATDEPVKSPWLQTWQLKCPCGECHVQPNVSHLNAHDMFDTRSM